MYRVEKWGESIPIYSGNWDMSPPQERHQEGPVSFPLRGIMEGCAPSERTFPVFFPDANGDPAKEADILTERAAKHLDVSRRAIKEAGWSINFWDAEAAKEVLIKGRLQPLQDPPPLLSVRERETRDGKRRETVPSPCPVFADTSLKPFQKILKRFPESLRLVSDFLPGGISDVLRLRVACHGMMAAFVKCTDAFGDSRPAREAERTGEEATGDATRWPAFHIPHLTLWKPITKIRLDWGAVRTLRLIGEDIFDSGASALGCHLPAMDSLRTLCIEECMLTATSARFLFYQLAEEGVCEKLEYFSLARNRLCDYFAASLTSFLRGACRGVEGRDENFACGLKSVKILDLTGCGLTASASVLRSVTRLEQLHSISLSGNALTTLEATDPSSFLGQRVKKEANKDDPVPMDVDVTSDPHPAESLGGEDAEEGSVNDLLMGSVKSARRGKGLELLDLSFSAMGKGHLEALGASLKKGGTVKSLRLGGNNLTDEGVKSFVQSVALADKGSGGTGGGALESLDLSACSLSKEVCVGLAKSAVVGSRKKGSLKRLGLMGNRLSGKEAEELEALVRLRRGNEKDISSWNQASRFEYLKGDDGKLPPLMAEQTEKTDDTQKKAKAPFGAFLRTIRKPRGKAPPPPPPPPPAPVPSPPAQPLPQPIQHPHQPPHTLPQQPPPTNIQQPRPPQQPGVSPAMSGAVPRPMHPHIPQPGGRPQGPPNPLPGSRGVGGPTGGIGSMLGSVVPPSQPGGPQQGYQPRGMPNFQSLSQQQPKAATPLTSEMITQTVNAQAQAQAQRQQQQQQQQQASHPPTQVQTQQQSLTTPPTETAAPRPPSRTASGDRGTMMPNQFRGGVPPTSHPSHQPTQGQTQSLPHSPNPPPPLQPSFQPPPVSVVTNNSSSSRPPSVNISPRPPAASVRGPPSPQPPQAATGPAPAGAGAPATATPAGPGAHAPPATAPQQYAQQPVQTGPQIPPAAHAQQQQQQPPQQPQPQQPQQQVRPSPPQ